MVQTDAKWIERVVGSRRARWRAHAERCVACREKKEIRRLEEQWESQSLDIEQASAREVGAADRDMMDTRGSRIDRRDGAFGGGGGGGAHDDLAVVVRFDSRLAVRDVRALS